MTHYLVRRRSVDKSEKMKAGVQEKSNSATIKVADYGSRVVRVQACYEAGCGKPVNKQFRMEPAPTPEPALEPKPQPQARPAGLRIDAEPGWLDVAMNSDDLEGFSLPRK